MALSVVIDPVLEPLGGTRYRALGRLGGGAMSEVFEAVDPRGRRCAVKVLRSLHVDAPDAVRRLLQEGEALAALDHPNLVPVLDVGVTPDGRPWFAMPRLVGVTLRDRLTRCGPIDPAEACTLLGGVLEGLDAAHAAGIVHRDVKPANIFLPARAKTIGPRRGASFDRAVVLDFGIAKITSAAGQLTTGAHVLGTPRYLAPEQVLGGAVDARTDVYAAGLTLYEALTGHFPYEGRSALELMRAHLESAPRPIRDHRDVSRELEHAVTRAIAKPPARRWPSARAFAAVLDRAAECERLRADEVEILELEEAR